MALNNNAILQHADGLVLNPDLRCQNFAHQCSLIVLAHPNFMPTGVGSAKGVEGSTLLKPMRRDGMIINRKTRLFVHYMHKVCRRRPVPELLPRARGSGVIGVNNHTETLVCRHTDREPYEKEWGDKQAPPTRLPGQDEKNTDDEAHDDVSDADIPYRENARPVAVTDRPTNEVGMGLPPEVSLDHIPYQGKGRRMRGVLKGMKDGRTITLGEIQFSGSVGGKIMVDDAVDFGPERLDSNYQACVSVTPYLVTKLNLQACQFNPACALASWTDSVTVRLELVLPEINDSKSNGVTTVVGFISPRLSKLTTNPVTLNFDLPKAFGG